MNYRVLLNITFLVILITGCASSAKPADNSGLLTLDQALKEAAARIDERLFAKSKIAPLNFNSPHDKFSDYVLEELTGCLVDTGKLTVVDRKEIDLVRSEIDFQYSGEVADESMQVVGRKLGAQSIISGSLTDMDGFYRIVIRVLNVQSSSVEVQYRANIESNRVVKALLTGGKKNKTASTQQRTTSTLNTVTIPAAPPAPTYKIGDTGPAGGIIFYDKGNNSGGWRYLEAAPADKEFKAQFGQPNVKTRDDVGGGKVNTQSMKLALEEKGEITRAAHRCTQLNINGYTDWFLPSKAELSWMYVNLKEKGLGGFSNDWYWSSSSGGYSFRFWGQKFSDGTQSTTTGEDNSNDKKANSVRAIRQF